MASECEERLRKIGSSNRSPRRDFAEKAALSETG